MDEFWGIVMRDGCIVQKEQLQTYKYCVLI